MACSHLALQLGLKSSKEVIPWESHQHEKKTSLLLFYVPLFPSLAYAQKDIQEEVRVQIPLRSKEYFSSLGAPLTLRGIFILPQSLLSYSSSVV